MFGKHAYLGDATGNPFQPKGRHEEGVALIPHGDRNRVSPDLIEGAIALDSGDNDPNVRYRIAAFDILSN